MKFCLKMLLSSVLTVSTVFPTYSYATDASCFTPKVDTKLYKAGDKIKIVVPLDVKNPNIPEKKYTNTPDDQERKRQDEARNEQINAETRARVYWSGTREGTSANLRYNKETKSMEGEIVVPDKLRKDASLTIQLEKYMDNRGKIESLRFGMSSPKDFPNPNIKTGEEIPTPPIIKMGKVEVVESIPSRGDRSFENKRKVVRVPTIKGSFTVAYQGALKKSYDGSGYNTGVRIAVANGGNTTYSSGASQKCTPKKEMLECTFEYPIDFATTGDEVLLIEAGDNLDNVELISNKDFKLNIPSTVVQNAERAVLESMKATALPNGKVRVEAKLENGVSKDKVYARATYFEKDKDKYGQSIAFGELTCLNDGNCSGVFDMPKFHGNPTRFELNAEIINFQFPNKYTKNIFPVSAEVFKSAKVNQPVESSSGSSYSDRYYGPRELCNIVGGVQVGNVSSTSGGGGNPAAAAAPK